eukprot:6515286-Prymnesium_polylepis.1
MPHRSDSRPVGWLRGATRCGHKWHAWHTQDTRARGCARARTHTYAKWVGSHMPQAARGGPRARGTRRAAAPREHARAAPSMRGGVSHQKPFSSGEGSRSEGGCGCADRSRPADCARPCGRRSYEICLRLWRRDWP